MDKKKLENLYLKMKLYAKENHVPIIEDDGLEVLLQILKEVQPARILEVGTAIAYSSLKMQEVTGGKIVTFERDHQMFIAALENIKLAECNEKIKVINSDLLEFSEQKLKELGTFDAIYIDAAKAQYYNFFKKLQGNLNEKTVILFDNMNFHGMVFNNQKRDLSKNVRALVSKMERDIQKFQNEEGYSFKILNNGDGIGILKKEKI